MEFIFSLPSLLTVIFTALSLGVMFARMIDKRKVLHQDEAPKVIKSVCDHDFKPCEHEAIQEFDECTKCGKII